MLTFTTGNERIPRRTFERIDKYELIEKMRQFVIKNIDKKEKNLEIESKLLEEEYWNLTSSYCCSSMDQHKLAELDHWNQLRILIVDRVIYKKHEYDPCCVLPYETKRYLRHGIPSIIIPTIDLFVFQLLYLSLFAASSILQIIKAQMDGGLSIYAQWTLLVGSIFASIYFLFVRNFVLIVPHVMNIFYAALLIYGIYSNCDNDVTCVYSKI